MSVRLRLKRTGRRNRAFYRIGAFHHTTRRDGKPVEDLGWYDPVSADDARRYLINLERAEYWLAQGALPSETVRSLIKRARRENQDQ
ncbi:MAG: 30S ribosomal protein S16 [Planctomycetota bacterium]|jgi:small subunit ribosomal protein S16